MFDKNCRITIFGNNYKKKENPQYCHILIWTDIWGEYATKWHANTRGIMKWLAEDGKIVTWIWDNVQHIVANLLEVEKITSDSRDRDHWRQRTKEVRLCMAGVPPGNERKFNKIDKLLAEIRHRALGNLPL